MTLRNPSFDLGTHRATLIGQPFGEIDVPLHWIAWWDSTLSRPEMKVIARTSPYLDPPRICHGTHAVQWFSFYRTHHAGLLQQVSTRPGNVLSLTARAHGWFSQFDDPRLSQYSGTDGLPVTIQDGEPGMELMVGIDPSGGLDPWSEDVVWSIQFWYSGYKSISLTVPASGSQATLYLASKTLHPFKHCDAYFDDVELVVEAGTGDPIPGPDPDGYPARAMVVDYNYIPDRAMRRDLYQMASDRGVTVTPSHDHAQAWPPGSSSYDVEIYNAPAHTHADLRAYYLPTINLSFLNHTETPPPPPPPPPDPDPIDPPTGGEGSPYALRSNCLIGLHSGFRGEKSDSYLQQSRTTIQKHFTAGDCYQVKRVAPDCTTIWRRYVGNEEGRIGEKATIRESARWYLDLYSQEIETAARNLGISEELMLACIDGIESLNETIPTRNPNQLRRSVEFDVDFAELTAERYGDELATVLLCGAVGNPDVDEVELLLPAASAVHRLGGFLGYHPYWTCNESTSFLEPHWQWHSGRWMEWDKVFTLQGYYPRYALGEGGCVYAWDGVNFNSGKGWKACGDIEKYLVDIAKWNRRALDWNAAHANRCAGITLFGYCNWGWDDFELGNGDVDLIARWASTL